MKAIQTSSLALTVAVVLGLGSTAHAGGRLGQLKAWVAAKYSSVIATGGVLLHKDAINALAAEYPRVLDAMNQAFASRVPPKKEINARRAVGIGTAVTALGALTGTALGLDPQHVEVLTALSLGHAAGLALLETKPLRAKVAGLKAALKAAMLDPGGSSAPARKAVEADLVLSRIWGDIQKSALGPTVGD